MEYLLQEEVVELLDSDVEDADKRIHEISRKRTQCVFGMIKGEKVLYTGKEASILFEKLLPRFEGVESLEGKAVRKGKVKGEVMIIPQTDRERMIDKAKKFSRGQILVTGMTQPEIVFACKKAAAIVTDEGGITSHAAIVSRELGIPCIIGTKHATKVFKDGDLVEVDAERGIVRRVDGT